jgi:hypothetical protein
MTPTKAPTRTTMTDLVVLIPICGCQGMTVTELIMDYVAQTLGPPAHTVLGLKVHFNCIFVGDRA